MDLLFNRCFIVNFSPVVLLLKLLILCAMVLQQRHLVCPHLKLPWSPFLSALVFLLALFCMLLGASMLFRVGAHLKIMLGLSGIRSLRIGSD